MSDEEDIDLLALQRQLDDAFETTRPRRGFDDELWLRLQARRPIWLRLQDGLAGLVAGLREAPAIPAAAIAVVLIVVIGVGLVSLSGLHFGAGSTSTTSGALAQPGSAPLGPDQASTFFGRLPNPALSSISSNPVDFGPSKAVNDLAPPQAAPLYPAYLGPATLTWSGQLNVTVTNAPVFRYQEPTGEFANVFAAKLGALPAASAGSGYLGTYSGQGFTLSVRSSSGAPPAEPFFVLTPTGSSQPSTGTPTDDANALLAAHNLLPSWPFQVNTATAGDQARVSYLRQFAIPGQGMAFLVDGVGERYGIAVDLKGGRTVRAAGPLPLGLDSSSYPIVSANQAVSLALASAPAGPATITPAPAVQLTTAELVYAVAHAGDTLLPGDHSFYEPCFLFSGTFTYNGTTYVKRVLVPAVDPSQRA